MSEVAGNQKFGETGDSFAAIQETIENLKAEGFTKWQEMMRSKDFDESLSENARLRHELYQLQIEINKKFCQLRSLCKDEEDVKKCEDLFDGFMVQTER